MALWDTFESRLVISATLRSETALRIGAGGDDSAQPSASDLPVLRGADDRPFIPGSSLRGVIRSQVERIVRTLEEKSGNGHGACDPTTNQSWCITANQIDGWKKELRNPASEYSNGDKELADRIWNQSCRVCRAFGSAWLAARVRIADLHLLGEGMVQIERRDGVAIDRDKETVQHKYDFETIPRATAFNLQITAENLEPAERGLLWLGLRELIEGHILLGGFKGRGLGRATLDDLSIQFVDATDRHALRDYLLQHKMTALTPAQMDEWLALLLDDLGLEGS
jgi:CRISPR-associated RAMP protein (TIGR02581 family)